MKKILNVLLNALIVIGLFYIVASFFNLPELNYLPSNIPIIKSIQIQGNSMLTDPDHKETFIAIRENKYDTGDIVVAKREDKLILKRIAGIPGDKITLNDGNLYINNELYSYSEGNGNAKYKYDYELILNEDEYFLIGDNYNNSLDSRVTGPYKHKDILYKQLKILAVN